MRRIDRIRTMTTKEMADIIFETGIDISICFCTSRDDCEEMDEIPEGMCKQCLINYLEDEDV